jgi:hypothetical protein
MEDLQLTLQRNIYPEQAWFTFCYSPVRDESGGVGGILCAVQEITKRVLAEAEQRVSAAAMLESEARWRGLFYHADAVGRSVRAAILAFGTS